MDNNSYQDTTSYARNSTKSVGTFLGLTKEDLLSSYGAPFNQLSESAQLAAALEARTEELLAKFATPVSPVGEGARTLARARSAADGALNELTGSYGGLVEEGVRELLEARDDEAAVSAAISTLHEACAAMVLTDLERLSDVIGLLMIVGISDKPKSEKPHGPHPHALSLPARSHDYTRGVQASRRILSDAAKQHRQNHQQ
jgi:hypothetical protein